MSSVQELLRVFSDIQTNVSDSIVLTAREERVYSYYKNLNMSRVQPITIIVDENTVWDLESDREEESQITISCPLCKTDVKLPENWKEHKLFTKVDKCCACMENDAQVYFPECGHICCCKECTEKIIETKKE